MKTLELRSLLNGVKKEISIPSDIVEVFNIWKGLNKKVSDSETSELDSFYAGYILSNPIVREDYKNANKTINK